MIVAAGCAVLPMAAVIGPAHAASASVRITSHLEPAELRVVPGTSITWHNADANRHRVRTTAGPGEFDGDMEPGESFTVTLSATGTYSYVDHRDEANSAYWGKVVVSSGAPSSGGGTGGTGSGGGTAPAPSSGSVRIANRAFSPSDISVAVGGTISWQNADRDSHTVTGSGFDSGILGSGGRFSHRFASAGVYGYVCQIHGNMRGTVTVTAAGGGAPPARPAPTGGSGSGGTAPSAPSAGGTAPQPASASASTLRLRISDFAFAPRSTTAHVGDALVWSNAGPSVHTVTSSAFSSGTIAARGTFGTVLRSAGTVRYVCSFHSNMSGTVTVLAARPGTKPVPLPASKPGRAGSPAGGTVTAPKGAPKAAVEIKDFAFSPKDLKVKAGTTVTWTNNGPSPHTVSGTGPDGRVSSPILDPRGTFRMTFTKVGRTTYTCAIHPTMTGTVTVSAGGAAGVSAPDASAAPSAEPADAQPLTPSVRMSPRAWVRPVGYAGLVVGLPLLGFGLLRLRTLRRTPA
jgi:plastocyanin